MGACFDDVAMVHAKDHVGIPDGGKTVGYHKGCSAFHEVFHAFLDQNFRSCINRGSSFIKNQNLRICNEGSRNCQAHPGL